MKEKKIKPYTELQEIFSLIGIETTDNGPAKKNINKQVSIKILAEQGDNGVILFFDIDKEGNELFVCQE